MGKFAVEAAVSSSSISIARESRLSCRRRLLTDRVGRCRRLPSAASCPPLPVAAVLRISGSRQTLQFWKQFGPLESLRRLVQTKEVMTGELKGSDHWGNQYYENLSRPPGRQRFVVYAGWGRSYDPSQVPPEWHQWLHAITDRTPVERPVQPRRYQLQPQPVRLSQYGMLGNYSPPGSFARQQPKTHSNYDVWEKDKAKETDDSGVQARV